MRPSTRPGPSTQISRIGVVRLLTNFERSRAAAQSKNASVSTRTVIEFPPTPAMGRSPAGYAGKGQQLCVIKDMDLRDLVSFTLNHHGASKQVTHALIAG